ncbi:MAG: flagellar protein FlgN [Rhodanobacter sp.]
MNGVPPGEVQGALQAVSEDMRQALDELALALEAELAAVRMFDSAALDSAGTRKQSLLKHLERLDTERRQLLREVPRARSARDPAWPEIERSLRTCQQLNQRNGKIVNKHLGQVREALSILTGHAGEGGLYDQTGGVRASLRSHVLARA